MCCSASRRAALRVSVYYCHVDVLSTSTRVAACVAAHHSVFQCVFHLYNNVYMCVHVCICMHVFIYMLLRVYTYMYIPMCICIHVFVKFLCLYAIVCGTQQTCIHIYILSMTYCLPSHTHIHERSLKDFCYFLLFLYLFLLFFGFLILSFPDFVCTCVEEEEEKEVEERENWSHGRP